MTDYAAGLNDLGYVPSEQTANGFVDRRTRDLGPPNGIERRANYSPVTLASAVTAFTQETYRNGLDFGLEHLELTTTFLSALATKPFVIFSGLSGAGKTRLATALGHWFGRERLLVQPVRPDWVQPSAVLGFENHAAETADAKAAWNVPRVLEFVLAAVRNPDEPYLLVFDEMNLAHVEQYFADVLSGMESGQPVVPNLRFDGTAWRLPSKENAYIPWPDNVFLIGTINVDETTYKFSPKVLDRATNIEFRVLPGALRTEELSSEGIIRGESHLIDLLLRQTRESAPSWRDRELLARNLQKLHQLMFEYDVEFGHRVFNESLRFGAILANAGMDDHRAALDFIVLYKILPKFEHSNALDLQALQALAGFCVYGPNATERFNPLNKPKAPPALPRSLGKLRRMARTMS